PGRLKTSDEGTEVRGMRFGAQGRVVKGLAQRWIADSGNAPTPRDRAGLVEAWIEPRKGDHFAGAIANRKSIGFRDHLHCRQSAKARDLIEPIDLCPKVWILIDVPIDLVFQAFELGTQIADDGANRAFDLRGSSGLKPVA